MQGSATPNGFSALVAAIAEQTDELAALGIELVFVEPNDETGRLLLGVECLSDSTRAELRRRFGDFVDVEELTVDNLLPDHPEDGRAG